MSLFGLGSDDGDDSGDDSDITADTAGFGGEGVYAENRTDSSSNEADTADEIDPRKLVSDVSLDEIRWYYRNGALASTVVDKPVEDAFKFGFTFESDGRGAEDLLRERLDEVNYVENYIRAQKKARRDGFALLYIGLDDSNEKYRAPKNVTEVTHLQTLTVENLTSVAPSSIEDKLPDGYDRDDVEVRDTGLVVSTDISDERVEKPVAYVLNDDDTDADTGRDPTVVHYERVQHFTWRDAVDHDTDVDALGEWEGDSVLQPVISLIKALHKGNWAAAQTLFRHSSPLHVGKVPEGTGTEEFDQFDHEMGNITSKSSFTLPPNYEIEVKGSGDGEVNPEPFFDALFDQFCAGTEFTRSVLFGTQSGTTTGSETDVKNYFNQVQRDRHNTHAANIRDYLNRVNAWSKRLLPNTMMDFEIEWEPMFQVDSVEKADAMARHVEVVTNGVSNYVLTPEEARSIVEEQWASFDVEVDFDALDEDDFDALDRVNRGAKGEKLKAEENEMEAGESPRNGQNGGGREGGQGGDPRDPASASTDDLTSDVATLLTDTDYDTGDVVLSPHGVGVVSAELTEKLEDVPGADGVVDATDDPLYAVGQGGAFGLYPADALNQLDEASPEAIRNADGETDGDTVVYHEGNVSVDDSSLPKGWDTASLLSWWSSIGGEWQEAKEALADEPDISEEQAKATAAQFKQMILGTDEQIAR